MKEVSRGEDVTFAISAAYGYEIIGSSVGSYKNGKLTLDKVQCSITVHVKAAKRTVITKKGLHWSADTKSDHDGKLLEGKRGAVIIKPDKNYFINTVTVNDIKLDEQSEGVEFFVDGSIRYECAMPRSLILDVSFLGDEYTLGLSYNDKGTASLNVPASVANYGDKIIVTTRPNKNCRLNYIRVNGLQVDGPTYEITLTTDTVIEVTFIDITAVGLYYDANGGEATGALNEGEYNPNITLNVDHCRNKITRSGYVLTGLNTEADGSGESYSLGSMIGLYDRSVTLYAQWAEETPASALKYSVSNGAATVTGLNDTSTRRLVIPEYINGAAVTTIAANAFTGSGITELVTNPNLTTIGNNALRNCASLKKVTLFDSLRSLPSNLLAGCDPNVRVYVNATSAPDASNLYEGSNVDR